MFPSLVGKTFGKARRSFDQAVLCGVMDAGTGQAHLNPADSCVLTDQHRLVFLSSTAKIQPSKQVTCVIRNMLSVFVNGCAFTDGLLAL